MHIQSKKFIRSGVSTVVKIHTVVFWVLSVSILISGYQLFREMYCPPAFRTLKFSEMMIATYQTAWCQNPEDHNINNEVQLTVLPLHDNQWTNMIRNNFIKFFTSSLLDHSIWATKIHYFIL
jgi:hypothetical protein